MNSDIHKHRGWKVRLGTFSNIRGCFGEKAKNFIKRSLIVICVILDVLEVGKHFDGCLIDKARGTH